MAAFNEIPHCEPANLVLNIGTEMIETIRATLARWLYAPPLAGQPAFLCVIGAVGVPTIVRLAVDGVVTGCEFTPYLPFVFVSAFLLRWWVASTVALISVGIMGGAFGGVPAHGWLCFRDSALIFLASSAMMVAVAVVVRAAVAALHRRGSDETAGGVVFSLEKGQVWASWYGQGSPMLLGSQRRVTEMMEDFLKQENLAKRLIRK